MHQRRASPACAAGTRTGVNPVANAAATASRSTPSSSAMSMSLSPTNGSPSRAMPSTTPPISRWAMPACCRRAQASVMAACRRSRSVPASRTARGSPGDGAAASAGCKSGRAASAWVRVAVVSPSRRLASAIASCRRAERGLRVSAWASIVRARSTCPTAWYISFRFQAAASMPGQRSSARCVACAASRRMSRFQLAAPRFTQASAMARSNCSASSACARAACESPSASASAARLIQLDPCAAGIAAASRYNCSAPARSPPTIRAVPSLARSAAGSVGGTTRTSNRKTAMRFPSCFQC